MEAHEITAIICKRLDISHSIYCKLMYEVGELYFEEKCKSWHRIRDAFRRSPQIWAWWKRQWEMMDEHIVLNNVRLKSREEYAAIHLGLEYYPNYVLVKHALDSYDKIIANHIKEATT